MLSSKYGIKHTKYDAFGIWSCVLGMLSLLFIAFAIGFITYTNQMNEPKNVSSSNSAQLERFIGFLYLEGIIAICGAALGAFGLCRKGRGKRLSITGVVLNAPGLAILIWIYLDPSLF